MSITNSDIKNAYLVWKEYFPELAFVGKNRLLRGIGPFLIGYELVRLRGDERYRPHFVLYGLWGRTHESGPIAILEGPDILYEYHDERNLQINIDYLQSTEGLLPTLDYVKSQDGLITSSIITLDDILAFLERTKARREFRDVAFQVGAIYGCMVAATVYFGDRVKGNRLIDEVKILAQNWNPDHFKCWKPDLNLWFAELEEKVCNSEVFIAEVEENKKDKRLKDVLFHQPVFIP